MAGSAALPAVSRGQSRRKVVLGASVLVGVAAFAAGPRLFEPAAEAPAATGGQVILFAALGALEATALGLAVALAALGGSAFRRVLSSRRRAAAVQVALVWALGSWWLHDGLHLANGMDLTGLLLIEYAFHVTVIAAALVVAYVLIAEARGQRG